MDISDVSPNPTTCSTRCSPFHLGAFLPCWQERAGRRWQLLPGVLPSSCPKEPPASQRQNECPRQACTSLHLKSLFTCRLHVERGDLYEYLLTPQSQTHPACQHTWPPTHPPEKTQPDDLCIIHDPQSLPTCYFLSSPSSCSSTPVQGRRHPLDY